MATYPTDVHGPAEAARATTGLYAVCQVCGTQWQVRSPNLDDAKGCGFCDAPEEAVTTVSEAGDYGHAVLVGRFII